MLFRSLFFIQPRQDGHVGPLGEKKRAMGNPEIKHDLVIKFGSQYGPEEERAVLDVLHQNAPTSGEACLQFEHEFAAYCGTRYARVVTNGTAALFLSMVGLGIKPGDRVITTPMTWIATAAAPATLGAEIDFVDIDPRTYNLDPNQLAEKITPADVQIAFGIKAQRRCREHIDHQRPRRFKVYGTAAGQCRLPRRAWKRFDETRINRDRTIRGAQAVQVKSL